jgi:hypothetical protein
MMPSIGSRFALPRTAALAAALLACNSVPAAAQIKVDGPAEAVRIDVSDAPLRDVLGALQGRFGLRYRSNDGLDTVRTLTLQGPLRRVVARLLEGYDFVIAVTPGGIDVLILQQSPAANANVALSRSLPPQPPAPAAPVAPSGQASYRERD